jgi:serine phosphatase RsbU (regulator of sigma subunit)
LIAGTEYPVAHLQFNQGDDLTLYTDGVLEAQSESGELFGFDRTADLLRSRPSVRAIAEAARAFGQVDDITVVKICRTPSEATQSHVAIDLQIATA